MKPSGETKLLLGMFAFVVLGAGLLFFLSRLGDPPARPAQARTPAATFDALLKDASHVKGSPDAPLTIIEFADFECPSCRRAYGSVASRFGKTIPARFVFRHLPLEMHPTAFPAAVAAEAAARQDKFWEMYDALFDPKAPPLDDAYLQKAARRIGLDMARFAKDRKDPAVEAQVREDMRLAEAHGVQETPTFFVRDASGQVTRVVGGNALQRLLAEKGGASRG